MFARLKEFIENTVDTIKDDRVSWKFKLCNIITNDALRWYIAVIYHHSKGLQELANQHFNRQQEASTPDCEVLARYAQYGTKRVKEAVEHIWKI